MALRDALLADDTNGITEAGESLQADSEAVATARGLVGVRGQRVVEQTTRIEDQQTQTASLLSDLRDADFNEVVSRFQQLQQQLQANLVSGQQMLSLSLLDFLR
jgi:flagellin-like hook-associated protein FlgL